MSVELERVGDAVCDVLSELDSDVRECDCEFANDPWVMGLSLSAASKVMEGSRVLAGSPALEAAVACVVLHCSEVFQGFSASQW